MIGTAVCAHAAFASALPRGARSLPRERAPIELVDVDPPLPQAPPSPPAEPRAAPAAEAVPPPVAHKLAARAVPVSEPAPVLTRAKGSDPGDVLDLTDAIVSGSGSSAVGGLAGSGASPSPAPDPRPAVRPVSVRPVPSVDRTRKPALAGGAEWSCPFPSDADSAGIDSALVSLRVALDAAGTVQGVDLRKDPGHGFGQAAERCARTNRWSPALDRQGLPVSGDVVLNVRFTRR